MDDTHAYHDFKGKLTQAAVLPHVVDYVRWQSASRRADAAGTDAPAPPDRAPISINLDLTTACNYRCDHCIDWDILNSGVQHKEQRLRDSLREMAARGMRSVILIGGGEPTMYPKFADIVRYLKQDLRQQVAVVSNGGRNDRILEVADCLEPGDWVRLSLDSGSDKTFQAMHRPRKPISLDEICEWVPRIKRRNPNFQVGFSFIVTWKGAQRDDTKVVENIHELVQAAELARYYRFDYMSVKPFLVRAEENGSEVMDPAKAQEEIAVVVSKIKAAIARARQLETDTFKIVESTNLRMLENQTWTQFTRQPRQCHMQHFRQVLTPHGVFNCPVYRSVPGARIAEADGYRNAAACADTERKTGELIRRFDSAHECRQVTCLYHDTNWWLESLIDDPDLLAGIQATPDRGDFYL
jgi:wyosine [tRNA(Phe)-imidazoG37] synthetase (radical SAM superfamily)